ncbi:MAG: hypothetical protein ACRD4I_07645, partial [Candidatus Angelobacter sp.]
LGSHAGRLQRRGGQGNQYLAFSKQSGLTCESELQTGQKLKIANLNSRLDSFIRDLANSGCPLLGTNMTPAGC